MSDVRVLIVDDEPLARRGVRLHLQAAGGFDIVGESASGSAAVADIKKLAPDVVFLDVQMPGISGFDVVELVGAALMPVTVFVTAYDAYALKAFDANAVDYILKPIDPARFRQMARRVHDLARAGAGRRRVILKDGSHVRVIPPEKIDWIQADGDYVRVHAGGVRYLVRDTLVRFAASLPNKEFARVHRSAIVNISRVRELRPIGDRSYRLTLDDGTVLKMSRTYRKARLAILQSMSD